MFPATEDREVEKGEGGSANAMAISFFLFTLKAEFEFSAQIICYLAIYHHNCFFVLLNLQI